MRKPTFLWICQCCQLFAELSGHFRWKKVLRTNLRPIFLSRSEKWPSSSTFFLLVFFLNKEIHCNLHWFLHCYVFNVGSSQIILKNAISKKEQNVSSAAEFYCHSSRIILKTLATLAEGQINAGKFSYMHTYFKGKQTNVLLSTC
jgi:hypothetical protein